MFEEKLKNLPEDPGVYIMKDSSQNVIYVGKAKILKNRVRQYFQKSKNHPPKVVAMVSNIADFEYIITDSELEALVLECNLIKKYKPRYNILLKDDKHYPYIKLTMNEAYPRILMTRKILSDKAKYFGPYTNSFVVKDTIEIIKKIFKIRTCNRNLPKDIGKKRPCLNYDIKRCLAPCMGYIGQEEYNEMFKEITSFLDGKQQILIDKLNKEMLDASESMNFEKAAILRDKINNINQLLEKQKIINSNDMDKDIIAFETKNDNACTQIFFIRGGKLIGREQFIIDGIFKMESQEILTSFIKQFYNNAVYVPKEIILQEGIEESECEVIEKWLSEKKGSKVYIKIPKKGENQKFIEMIKKNARKALEEFEYKTIKEKDFANKALEELKNLLNLEDNPTIIRAYDISNTAGMQSVGAMIVFKEGKPNNSEYKKFAIKTVQGPNDYESMKEVIFRRFKRYYNENKDEINEKEKKFSNLPNLILLDGGKGHVSSVIKVMQELQLDIPVFGMVKDDKHKTRGITTRDYDIDIPINSNAFKLIYQIQEEVHRVAINYHRNKLNKINIESELENIKGIGKTRRSNLLKHFKSIDKIKRASVEELNNVKGIDKDIAINIFKFFN